MSVIYNQHAGRDDEKAKPEDFMPYYIGKELDQDEILAKRTEAILAKKKKEQFANFSEPTSIDDSGYGAI